MTLAPLCAKARAIANPMPEVEPVTTAFFPLSMVSPVALATPSLTLPRMRGRAGRGQLARDDIAAQQLISQRLPSDEKQMDQMNASPGRPLDPLAAVAMVVLCASWGLNQVAIKLALPEIPPFTQAALRSLGALPVVLAIARLRNVPITKSDGT